MCRCDNHRVSTQAAPRLASIAVGLLLAIGAGCTQEMANQPRYEPLEPSSAFSDDMSSRPPVPGTVPRGHLQLDAPFYTGKQEGRIVTTLPELAIADDTPAELLLRGRERYSVYCSHCHGLVGGGVGGAPEFEGLVGMVVLRGFSSPPTFHQERLRNAPVGYLFDVITNGFGRMPAHGYLVPPKDRWAIVTYIRALQLSQHASLDELSAEDVRELGPQTAAL